MRANIIEMEAKSKQAKEERIKQLERNLEIRDEDLFDRYKEITHLKSMLQQAVPWITKLSEKEKNDEIVYGGKRAFDFTFRGWLKQVEESLK